MDNTIISYKELEQEIRNYPDLAISVLESMDYIVDKNWDCTFVKVLKTKHYGSYKYYKNYGGFGNGTKM